MGQRGAPGEIAILPKKLLTDDEVRVTHSPMMNRAHSGSLAIFVMTLLSAFLTTQKQGDCTGDRVDPTFGLFCKGNCDPAPPACLVVDSLDPKGRPFYQYCGCTGLQEPSCCHLIAITTPAIPNSPWVPAKSGHCTPCPLIGTCTLVIDPVTHAASADCLLPPPPSGGD
jgi:hypothetical protein